MYYCEECHLLSEEKVCRECMRKLNRGPEKGDFCLLTEKEEMWANVLSNILTDAEIQNVCVPVLGAGMSMSIGSAFERKKVYVPFEKFEEAKELLCEWENPADAPASEE